MLCNFHNIISSYCFRHFSAITCSDAPHPSRSPVRGIWSDARRLTAAVRSLERIFLVFLWYQLPFGYRMVRAIFLEILAFKWMSCYFENAVCYLFLTCRWHSKRLNFTDNLGKQLFRFLFIVTWWLDFCWKLCKDPEFEGHLSLL